MHIELTRTCSDLFIKRFV